MCFFKKTLGYLELPKFLKIRQLGVESGGGENIPDRIIKNLICEIVFVFFI